MYHHYKQCMRHLIAALLMINIATPVQAHPWWSSEKVSRLQKTMHRWLKHPVVLGAITVVSLTAIGSLAAYYFREEDVSEHNDNRNGDQEELEDVLLVRQPDELPLTHEEREEALRLQQQYDQARSLDEVGPSNSFAEKQEHEAGAGITDSSDEEGNEIGKEEEEQEQLFQEDIERFLAHRRKSSVECDMDAIRRYQGWLDPNHRLWKRLEIRWLRDAIVMVGNLDEKRELLQQLRKLEAIARSEDFDRIYDK